MAAALALMAALNGCGKPADDKPVAQPPAQSDYVPPPELIGARQAQDGALVLSGAGLPLARIRLASPVGSAVGATAGADGRWSVTLPGAAEPRLYSLSQDLDGRMIRARGYLAVLPGGAATMLRPSTGARPMIGPQKGLVIGAVDFDAVGAGVVSGRTRPDRPVRVLLDGQDAGEGRSDQQGWFDVSLSDSLRPTSHQVAVSTPEARAQAAFDATRAGPIAVPPFNASRAGDAWRIDWMAPGGGVQSTYLFDLPQAGSGAAR